MAEAYPAETNQAGTITSFIALPTIFTPPSSCSTIYRLNGFSLVAYDPGFGIDIDTRVRCAPGAVTTWWEQARLGINTGEGHTAVSIGPLTCPDRWTTVAASVKNEISTLAMCCPLDYTLANGISGSIAGDCRSNVMTDAVLTYASTPATNPRAWTMATTTIARPTYIGAIAVVGWNIDTKALETSSSSTTSALETTTAMDTSERIEISTTTLPHETASESFPTTTQSVLTETSSSTPQSLPLTTTIGIGVGVGVGVIALAGLAFLVWRRKRKQQRVSEAPPVTEPHPPTPFEPDKYSYVTQYHELYGQRHERNPGAAEMPVPQYVAELDASMHVSK